MQFIPILVISFAILLSVAIIVVAMKISARNRNKANPNALKDRETIIKEANRRLAANPKDPVALRSLADLYYDEGDFPKAMRTYRLLLDLSTSHETTDMELNLRHGLASMHCEEWAEAYKSLMIAKSKKADVLK